MFINSDPGMIMLFLAYLRAVGVTPDRLRLRVSIHESADVPAATAFWADLVGVPEGELPTADTQAARAPDPSQERRCGLSTAASS